MDEDSEFKLSKLIFRQALLPHRHLDFIMLDTSSSTLSNGALSKALGTIKYLCQVAYYQRNHFAILCFGNNRVSNLLSPRRAPKQLDQVLKGITAGGGTPLRQGLLTARLGLREAERTNRYCSTSLYIFTDGRSTDRIADINMASDIVIVDTEQKAIKLGKCKVIAQQLNASYITINDLCNHGLVR